MNGPMLLTVRRFDEQLGVPGRYGPPPIVGGEIIKTVGVKEKTEAVQESSNRTAPGDSGHETQAPMTAGRRYVTIFDTGGAMPRIGL